MSILFLRSSSSSFFNEVYRFFFFLSLLKDDTGPTTTTNSEDCYGYLFPRRRCKYIVKEQQEHSRPEMKQHFILPSSPPNEIRKADRSTDFRDMLMLRRSPRQRDERLWGSTLSRIIKFQTSIKNNKKKKKKKEENETKRGTRKHFVLSHRLRSSPRNLSSIQKLFPIPSR